MLANGCGNFGWHCEVRCGSNTDNLYVNGVRPLYLTQRANAEASPNVREGVGLCKPRDRKGAVFAEEFRTANTTNKQQYQ